METVKDTALEVGTTCWSLGPPTPCLLVVVKGTFDLIHGRDSILAAVQEPCTEGLYHDDDPTQTVRYGTDFAFVKPRAEALLMGHCHAPGDAPVTTVRAAFSVGDLSRELTISGDRVWKLTDTGIIATDPEPFTAMPLRWERAFGGPAIDANPVGRGIGQDAAGRVPLPNIEDPRRPVTSPLDRPAPAGAFPIPSRWPARKPLIGTCDERWQTTRAPFLPEDFNPAYFNTAPPELRQDDAFRGDEVIVLKNLVAGAPELESRLPGLRARAFVEWDRAHGQGFDEVRLRLDTITVDTDSPRAICVWRGIADLPGTALTPTGVARLFVMDEPHGRGSSLEECRDRMAGVAGISHDEEVDVDIDLDASAAGWPGAATGEGSALWASLEIEVETGELPATAPSAEDTIVLGGLFAIEVAAPAAPRSLPGDIDAPTVLGGTPRRVPRTPRDIEGPPISGVAPRRLPADIDGPTIIDASLPASMRGAPSPPPVSAPETPPSRPEIDASTLVSPVSDAPRRPDLARTTRLAPDQARAELTMVLSQAATAPAAPAPGALGRTVVCTEPERLLQPIPPPPVIGREPPEEKIPPPEAPPAEAPAPAEEPAPAPEPPLPEAPVLRVTNLTPFPVGIKRTSTSPPRPEMTVVVRGRFDLVPGGTVRKPEGLDPLVQGPLTDEVYAEGDDARAGELLYPGDFADLKLATDVLYRGTCHVPRGKPLNRCPVGIAVGEWRKALWVVGQRVWKEGLFGPKASEPRPFTEMPVTWARSFGGPGFAPNPVGVGLALELPNIESAEQPVRTPKDRPAPAGFGPINPRWPVRSAKVGTRYGADYQRTRAPYYASDFDWTYFNTAPPDQQVPGYLKGDEQVRLQNLHPEHPVLTTRLPGLSVRCFVTDIDGRSREVTMRLDTLFIDGDAGQVFLTWRGVAQVDDCEFEDIATILVASAPLDAAPRSLAEYEEMASQATADQPGLDAPGAPPAPSIAPPALALVPPLGRALLPPLGRTLVLPPGPTIAPPALALVPDLGQEVGAGPVISRGEGGAAGPTPADGPLAAVAPGVERALLPADLGPGADLSGQDLGGRDLSGADFSGAILTGAVLRGAVLTRANLRGAVLIDADLGGADLDGADLGQVNAARANLTGASLRGAEIGGAYFGQAQLRGARLDGARGSSVFFTRADLTEASLANVELERADIESARLERASFEGAKLDRCLFHRCRGASVEMPRADLGGCSFEGSDLSGASFGSATARATIWTSACLEGADLRSADLDGAFFDRVRAARARFDRATLVGARFFKARLDGAVFAGAKLVSADLSRCSLDGASFVGANLFEANLLGAGGVRCDFTGANVKRCVRPG
jgi:uncharacterized protein YjbI with pentapeptide repeats